MVTKLETPGEDNLSTFVDIKPLGIFWEPSGQLLAVIVTAKPGNSGQNVFSKWHSIIKTQHW